MLRERLRHRFTALSRKGFGIHSPFIFDFQRKILHPKRQDKALYLQINKEKNMALRAVLRMQIYFNLSKILVCPKNWQKGFDQYGFAHDISPQNTQTYDCIVINATDNLAEKWLKEEAFVILIGEYNTVLQHQLRKKCNVFLDLYDIGICIFKKGLSKQEFKLRL